MLNCNGDMYFISGLKHALFASCLLPHLWSLRNDGCRWGEFCHTEEIHPITPINNAVEFLSYLYDNDVWFAVIVTARSTLGNFIHVPGINCPGQSSPHPKNGGKRAI